MIPFSTTNGKLREMPPTSTRDLINSLKTNCSKCNRVLGLEEIEPHVWRQQTCGCQGAPIE